MTYTVIILVIAQTLIVTHPLLLGRKVGNFRQKMAKHTASYNRPPLWKFPDIGHFKPLLMPGYEIVCQLSYSNYSIYLFATSRWHPILLFKSITFPLSGQSLHTDTKRWYRSMIPIIDHPQFWAFHGKVMPLINAQPQQQEGSIYNKRPGVY